ncbi:MAG TPA: heme o synthase [Polyangiales bacterium]|jgi:protoheme IX farnesyltransferase|nr:heme o synthase [Polyangiales bacterium]
MSTQAVTSGPRGARGTARWVPTFRDLVSLTKPRVSSLVIATSAAGMGLAPGEISKARAGVMLLGTLLCVASANALNCFMERESDKLMTRTRNRALPAGRLDPSLALGFGLLLGAVSVPMLVIGVNLVTGLLGLLALTSYVGVYTPMKSQSSAALIVGAVPGALPPLMGYTAVAGHIGAIGLHAFAILFLWQIPHVIGLASFRKDDYVAAGIRVVPAVFGERATKLQAVLWTVVLCAVSVLPYTLGWVSAWYLVPAFVLGAAYLVSTLRGFASASLALWGRRVFVTSLFYLPLLFLALLFTRLG